MPEDGKLRFFFCIGVQKSGTTILARVLDQHPKIACIWESYALKPRAGASILNLQSASWRRHGFKRRKVERWAASWGGRPRALMRRFVRRLAGRDYLGMIAFRKTMPYMLADFAQRCGASVVGDKWPWYIDYLEETMAIFPHAKFIYNVRDPRGIWNSAQRFKQRQRGDEILQEMLEKDRQVSPYLDLPNFFTLRFRDLVCQPEKTCRKLYAFLGCDFKKEYLRYRPDADPYPERWHWIPEASGPIDPWHARKWQEEVEPGIRARITEEAGWFIEKYGYKL